MQDVYEVILNEIYETVDPFETGVAVPAVRTLTTIEKDSEVAKLQAQKKEVEEEEQQQATADAAKEGMVKGRKASKGKKKGRRGKGGRGRSRCTS